MCEPPPDTRLLELTEDSAGVCLIMRLRDMRGQNPTCKGGADNLLIGAVGIGIGTSEASMLPPSPTFPFPPWDDNVVPPSSTWPLKPESDSVSTEPPEPPPPKKKLFLSLVPSAPCGVSYARARLRMRNRAVHSSRGQSQDAKQGGT